MNLLASNVQKIRLIPELSNFGHWIWSEQGKKRAYALNSSGIYQSFHGAILLSILSNSYLVCVNVAPQLTAVCYYGNGGSPDSDARLVIRGGQKLLITVFLVLSIHN